jgi:short-subunit dehydrogenase
MIGNKSMELKSTVVVITGASSGIGRATALELAQKRASLVLVARREEALHGLAEECERLGGRALAVPTDVSIEGHVYGVVQKALHRFGKVDVWINNAAVTVAGHFEDIPMRDFRRVLEINLFGYIYGSRAIIPYFKKQGKGTIINVSSMVGVSGEPYFTPYAISKFGIRGLSMSLHQELEKENIHVCTVLPGVIDTPIYNQAANYMGLSIKTPGKPIPAEDVANSIIKLIEKPQREVFVGVKGKTMGIFSFLAPGIFDKQNEAKIQKEHFDHERETSGTTGNLYDPMKEYASVSGGWIQNNGSQKLAKFLIPISIITGAAVGIAWYFKNQKLQIQTK